MCRAQIQTASFCNIKNNIKVFGGCSVIRLSFQRKMNYRNETKLFCLPTKHSGQTSITHPTELFFFFFKRCSGFAIAKIAAIFDVIFTLRWNHFKKVKSCCNLHLWKVRMSKDANESKFARWCNLLHLADRKQAPSKSAVTSNSASHPSPQGNTEGEMCTINKVMFWFVFVRFIQSTVCNFFIIP